MSQPKSPKNAAQKATPLNLPETLSGRMQALRELVDLTPRQLSNKALVDLSIIEDIEAGIDQFLSPAVRLKLARALRVRPDVLEEVEHRPKLSIDQPNAESNLSLDDKLDILTFKIRQTPYPETAYNCPLCQSDLIVRQFDRLDINEQPITAYKIQCSQCLFQHSLEV